MQRPNGFTLLETMVVLALGAVLAALALPSMRSFAAGRQLHVLTGELAASLRLARSEAIKRGVRVSLCRSPDGQQCAANTSGRDWASGWLVFVDHGVRGVVEPGDQILSVQPASLGGVQVLAAGTATYVVSFLPSGVAPGAQNNFRFLPALAAGTEAYRLAQQVMCVSATGGTRLVRGTTC